ncbi:MAG: ComEC/Rec2 family competence protein [Burkholderiales bacterium]
MNSQTGYEIDFLPVGNGERSGDAIAVRYGSTGNYKVMVYDGGTQESGQALVDHIRTYYETNRVDYVVNSHPDADHASGLAVVLEQMEVGELWMHRPWNYSDAILGYFQDSRITSQSLADRLQAKMAAAYALEELALGKGISIKEPFQGCRIGEFVVLSPNKEWYVHTLIPEFEKSPEQKDALGIIEAAMKKSMAAARTTITWIAESWGHESLRENVETSAENDSSAVLFAVFSERGVLLTGDSGIRALSASADLTESVGISLPDTLSFAQIPHHGSRNNVSTSALDRILGPRMRTNDAAASKVAFVSAGENSKTHPRKIVVNAFIRRGWRVIATQGSATRHHFQMPNRNWGPASPMPFSNEGESWD